MAAVASPAAGGGADVAKVVLSEVAGDAGDAGTLGQGTMPFEEEEPPTPSTDPADSCLPPLPHDMFIASTWEDVARCSAALAKATPDRDPLRNCALVSEEEYLRMRLDRLGKLLETYRLEQVRLQGALKQKRCLLKDAVWARVSRARLGGKAYSGWVPSEEGGEDDEARDEQAAAEERDGTAPPQVSSCISLDAEGSGVCGLPCLSMAQYCAAHVAEQPMQHLYKVDPATGNSVIRSGSIAQIQRLRKEVPGVPSSPAGSSHKKMDSDLVPLSLNTNVSPGEGGGKLRTPDRLLAQSLAAASAPFPPATSKEAREQPPIEGDDVSEEELVKLMRTIQDKRAHLLQAHQQAQKLHREQQQHQQAVLQASPAVAAVVLPPGAGAP